jgi:hypothetical protein
MNVCAGIKILLKSASQVLLGLYYTSNSISISLGGLIVSATDSFLSAYYLSAFISFLLFLYATFVLPESIKPIDQSASSNETEDNQISFDVLNIFYPMRIFFKFKKLLWIGAGIFVTRAAGQFTTELILCENFSCS